jgi:hypothetical protein
MWRISDKYLMKGRQGDVRRDLWAIECQQFDSENHECGPIREASTYCPTSHHRDQQARDRIQGQRQKAASSGNSAPHTGRIPRCMDATHTGPLRARSALIRNVRSSGNREQFSGSVCHFRPAPKRRPRPVSWSLSIRRNVGWDPLLDCRGNRLTWNRRVAPQAA